MSASRIPWAATAVPTPPLDTGESWSPRASRGPACPAAGYEIARKLRKIGNYHSWRRANLAARRAQRSEPVSGWRCCGARCHGSDSAGIGTHRSARFDNIYRLVRLLLVFVGMSTSLWKAGIVGAIFVLGSAAAVRAQGLDPASAAALAATLRMLADPDARGQVIGSTPGAADIDRNVLRIAGSAQLAQEMYAVAAAVFADLARSANGNTAQMFEALERARLDPHSFIARLSPDTLQQLRELSSKIAELRGH
jgi:hypothetical protein